MSLVKVEGERMCLQDRMLSRKTQTTLRTIQLSTSPQQILGTDARRVRIVVPGLPTGHITIADNAAFVANQGIIVPQQSQALVIDVERFGDFPTRQLWASVSTGTPQWGYLEVVQLDEDI